MNSVSLKVELEQVKTLYKSIGSLVLINLIVSGSLVYVFWELVPHSTLLIWMGLMIAMLTFRVAVYHSFSKKFNQDQLPRYKTFMVLGSLSAGIIWGGAGVALFVPDQLEYQLFIVMSLLAMTGGSAFSLSIYLPAYFAFVPIALLPMVMHLFMIGGTSHIGLASVTLIFLVALTLFNFKINKSLTNALSLQFENLELIDKLKTQRQEADRANLAKSKFLAAASHDLRQPLYALTLHTAALDEKDRDPASQLITSQINNSVDALQSLFDALLDISVLDAGVVEVNKSDFSLNDLFAKLGNEFTPLAREKNVQLHWSENAGMAHSDPKLIEQILRNFLSNAIRNTDAGEISMRNVASENSNTIQVADTGTGISISEHEAIFDEFHQVGNPERDRQKGLGLGLSIVKRAADLLGHKVSLVSELGKGSTFSVTVDKCDQQETASEHPTAVPPFADVQTNILVVVIDDDAVIRNGQQQLLSLWGCDVIVSANLNDAIKQLEDKGRKPGAIISDYRLRENQTGVEAIIELHSRYGEDIPALIVTGDTSSNVLRTLKDTGAQVLHKPVAPAKLRAFLRNASSTPRAIANL